MNQSVKKIAEILLVVGILAGSLLLYIFYDSSTPPSEWGYVGLFVLCLLSNATVFLPSPSLLLAASCALVLNPFWVAVVAALGSTLGELTGYLLGNVGQDLSPKFQRLMETITQKVKNPFVLIFVLALLPLPLFDVAGVYSGGTKVKLLPFFLLCFTGKFLKLSVYTHFYEILEQGITLLT